MLKTEIQPHQQKRKEPQQALTQSIEQKFDEGERQRQQMLQNQTEYVEYPAHERTQRFQYPPTEKNKKRPELEQAIYESKQQQQLQQQQQNLELSLLLQRQEQQRLQQQRQIQEQQQRQLQQLQEQQQRQRQIQEQQRQLQIQEQQRQLQIQEQQRQKNQPQEQKNCDIRQKPTETTQKNMSATNLRRSSRLFSIASEENSNKLSDFEKRVNEVFDDTDTHKTFGFTSTPR